MRELVVDRGVLKAFKMFDEDAVEKNCVTQSVQSVRIWGNRVDSSIHVLFIQEWSFNNSDTIVLDLSQAQRSGPSGRYGGGGTPTSGVRSVQASFN